MKQNTEADVRTDTAIKILALFFVAIIFLAFTTSPIKTGTKEGERAARLEIALRANLQKRKKQTKLRNENDKSIEEKE